LGLRSIHRACAINAVSDFCEEDADCQCRIVPFSQAIPDLTSRPLLRVSAEPKEILNSNNAILKPVYEYIA
jgi:hypothetical protein